MHRFNTQCYIIQKIIFDTRFRNENAELKQMVNSKNDRQFVC